MSVTSSNERVPATSPTVVVKLREARPLPLVAANAPSPAEQVRDAVLKQFPGATVRRTFASVGAEVLERTVREANEIARKRGGLQAPDLNTYFSVVPPAGASAKQVRDFIASSNRDVVEKAYVDEGVKPALVSPWDDPQFAKQGYVRGRRGNKRGIYANFAWGFPGGDGSGVGVSVVDFGFLRTHEDLTAAGIAFTAGTDVATLALPVGVKAQVPGYIGHGTKCVGEILGQDNSKGIVGIAPKAKGSVVSIVSGTPSLDSAGNITAPTDTSGNLFKGILAMKPGDVMSVSLQTAVSNYPIEINDANFWAIWLGSILGRIICTAAGNGRHDLDAFTDAAGKFILNPDKHADFRDSGAIMVGAATDTRPHDCINNAAWGSNYGKRINCFAWGQNVTTTGSASASDYTDTFNGTSAATPIIAGAAALTQGLSKVSCKKTLLAWNMRDVLASEKTTIRSRDHATRPIGRMPNMCLIYNHYIKPSCKITGVYGSPAQAQLFLDPGHGGDVAAGRSTAYGGRGPRGTTEKEVALALAQRVQARFGGRVALSRDGDYNLSLRNRLEAARRFGAPAFVSLHAHAGARALGPQVWVYGDRQGRGRGGPDPFALDLARSIRDEIAAVDDRPVRIREGRIGVLHPRYHGDGVAACMVEAGPLDDEEGEERLGDQSRLDALGGAIARGVDRYIGAASGAEGDDMAFAADDDDIDPEDTDGPGSRAQAFGEDEESAASPDEDRFGNPRGHNGVHHESY